MIIKEIIGNKTDYNLENYTIDCVEFEWFELNKRIQRKTTQNGVDIALKFLAENIAMKSGDILWKDDEKKSVIVVSILPTDTIVLSPKTMSEMATVCYEIGNKHMPLFIENDQILLPYEAPMFRWLSASGYSPIEEKRTLTQRLKSNVSDHHHTSDQPHRESLFTKVINFASKNS